jgi:membrane fusion protein, copper/silver efflux system
MKKHVAVWMVALLAVAALFAGCRKSDGEHAHRYTCPMHPEVVQDSPGKCPQCGMELTLTH